MYLAPDDGGPELFRIEADMETPAPPGDSEAFEAAACSP